MRRNFYDSPTHKVKEMSRKLVINSSDTESELSEDIYCPSWLKDDTTKASTIIPDTSSIISSSMMSSTVGPLGSLNRRINKRDISLNLHPNLSALTSRNPHKKIDSPIKTRFFEEPSLNKFQSILIELIETEIAYYKDIKLVSTIYKSLLDNVEKYHNLFTKIEKDLIFNEITKISEFSLNFIKSIINNLIYTSGFKNLSFLEKFKINNEEQEEVLNYDVTQLVINCEISRINFGLLINDLIDSKKFKVLIISYFTKHDFRIGLLTKKIKFGGLLIKEWLSESNQLIKFESNDWSLQSLLIKPVQRLLKYPLFLKSLNDNLAYSNDIFKHELSVALIKINQLIERCNRQEKVKAWDDLERFEKDLELEFCEKIITNQLDQQPLNSANDLKLSIAGKQNIDSKTKWQKDFSFINKNPQPKKHGLYVSLIIEFKNKYESLKKIESAFINHTISLNKFIEAQLAYSKSWQRFLEDEPHANDDRFIKSIYSSFTDKVSTQLHLTKLVIEELDDKIVKSVQLTLSYCNDVRSQIRTHRKYRKAYIDYIKDSEMNSKQTFFNKKKYENAQVCIKIENQLKDKLPKLIALLNSLILLLLKEFNKIYCLWFQQLIGERSLKEYNQRAINTSEQLKHQDIVTFYNHTMDLTKVAIQETSSDSIKYFNKFSL